MLLPQTCSRRGEEKQREEKEREKRCWGGGGASQEGAGAAFLRNFLGKLWYTLFRQGVVEEANVGGGRAVIIHVLIIEDDPLVSGLIEDALKLTFRGACDLTFAYNGKQGLEQIEELRPDVVILDLLMPEMNGYELLRALRKSGDGTPVIVLTALDQEEDEVRGFDSGCDDYIIKPFTPRVLYHRMQVHLRRREGNQGSILRYADVEMDVRRRKVHRGERELELTPREFAVLECFLRYPEQVLRRELLLRRVWEEEGESNVVDVYGGRPGQPSHSNSARSGIYSAEGKVNEQKKGVHHMVLIDIWLGVTLLLVALIVGMIMGGALVHPRSWR
jgi:DNA-binding response OmpR family regulator